MLKIIDPHKKISREVTEKDISTIIKIAFDMANYCSFPEKHWNIKAVMALAHCQVEKKDPLRFFTTVDGELIINPVIIRHTEVTVDSLEGCVSFPSEPSIIVQRWNKCEVKYQVLENNKLVEKEEKLSGLRAKVFQHEIDHFDAKYIYELK
jgi:peptide deformylase